MESIFFFVAQMDWRQICHADLAGQFDLFLDHIFGTS